MNEEEKMNTLKKKILIISGFKLPFVIETKNQ